MSSGWSVGRLVTLVDRKQLVADACPIRPGGLHCATWLSLGGVSVDKWPLAVNVYQNNQRRTNSAYMLSQHFSLPVRPSVMKSCVCISFAAGYISNLGLQAEPKGGPDIESCLY